MNILNLPFFCIKTIHTVNTSKLNSNNYSTVNNVKNFGSYQNSYPKSYPKGYCLNQISFAGYNTPTAIKLIETIGEENFPNSNILETLRSYGESKDYSLYDIHLEYYKDLLSCKTLNEAKEKYPEFKDVKDAKDMGAESMNKKSVLYKISRGKIEGITLDTLSLEFLKKYYGKLYGVKKQEEYWGLSNTAVKGIARLLNIKILDNKYASTAAMQSPKTRQKQSVSIGRSWKDSSSGLNSEERKQKQSASKRLSWKDPNSGFNSDRWLELNAIKGYAKSLAWKKHPEIAAIWSEIAKDYPLLSKILAKSKSERTEEDKRYERIYNKVCHNACNREFPGYIKNIICKEAKRIYAKLKKEYEQGIVDLEIIEYVKEQQEKEGIYKGVDFSRFVEE